MCHGLIEQRVAVSVPDLLRNQCYPVEPDYEKSAADDKGDFPLNDFGQDSGIFSMIDEPTLLRETSGLSDGLSEDALADIVKDYSSAVKKFDSEDVDNVEADALASTGSLSTWFDCIKDNVDTATDSVLTKSDVVEVKLSPQNTPLDTAQDTPKDDSNVGEEVPKSRKARKSAAKEQSHAQHDSEMDEGAPVLIDEKRKRRMSSNRASAQRSRQRKQERLDELEILTAQLRLENATLARRSKIAEQLAKRIQVEKNALAKQVEELKKELEATRQPRTQGSSASGDESDTSGNLNSGVCDMVEGGETSPDAPVDAQTPSKGNPMKRIISSTDLTTGLFQELYDAFESDQFDVSLGDGASDLLQEEWYGSFTECLNA
ncbi:hypothetical protein KC19_6G030600 [Ceratodon purpureus]|uniref:BZIP domain-containing protein n=1 Tax=Ceratodon purpureus TaxID=3225 RepID=A0A8T0HBD1_CERPU|nr:hypothetical protein KC19_6G030600 [Ceratodon purpureus]